MQLALMPRDPTLRAEAQAYLRFASALAFILATLGGFAMTAIINSHTETDSALVVAFSMFLPTIAVGGFGYLNARTRYRLVSPDVHLLLLILVIVTNFTIRLQMFGSTTVPTPGWYGLLIVLMTVYFTARAGALTLLWSLIMFGTVVFLEVEGVLMYSPLITLKRVILKQEDYAFGIFVEVTVLLNAIYIITFYIARALSRRRQEVDEANQELLALHETKDRFLGIVSHDLRTPITSIKAFADIIEDEAGEMDVEDEKRFASTISAEAERLHRLVTDLLDLDKMEAGKMEWNLSPQDLRPLLDNAVQIFRAAAKDKDVGLHGDYDSHALTAAVDADRIAQLLANLLSNAIKFTPAGGSVTLAAGQDDSSVILSIADTGPGISAQDRERIFDRFSQTESGKAAGGGTGLGLAIVKEIVEGHRGTVSVDGRPEGGTIFTVTLPAPQQTQKAGTSLPRL